MQIIQQRGLQGGFFRRGHTIAIFKALGITSFSKDVNYINLARPLPSRPYKPYQARIKWAGIELALKVILSTS